MAARTILVIVDPNTTTKQPVLERAAWLAERVGADLELFACDYDWSVETGPVSTIWVPKPGARERLLDRHRQALDVLAAPLRARGLTVTVDIVWDYPLEEAIVKKVVARKPWLVAKDVEHHNVVQRTFLSNIDWHVIRNCPVPLLLTKPRPVSGRPNVMAAVDPLHQHDKPAELDDAIFQFADAFARSIDGTLHVVHAIALPRDLDLPPDVITVLTRQQRDAMESFLKTHTVERANVHLVEGAAHDCIKRAAEKHGADFVVMGAVARSRLKKLFIGSTAERVLDKLPCDLVIIKPPGIKTAVLGQS
jgi:universal stress protein E